MYLLHKYFRIESPRIGQQIKIMHVPARKDGKLINNDT